MRVLVDATPARFGGLATYVEGLVGAWSEVAPDDELHVVLAKDSAVSVGTGAVVREHRLRIGSPRAIRGPAAQSFVLPRLAREVAADVVLCVIPTVPVRPIPVPIAVVVHDLRHELLPDQFGFSQRLLRRVAYSTAYARAAGTICVSERTRQDLLRLHPRVVASSSTVVPHGADHVDRWRRASAAGHALAFGHTANKRPELVLDTWKELAARGGEVPHLHVVGLDGQARAAVVGLADARGLAGAVTAHPFLPDEAFRRVLTAARVVVFPSDFEGFGLPVLEAMKLGIPVVVGPEPSLAEVAAGHAFTADSLVPERLADAVTRALGATGAESDAARRHADTYTWSRTVRLTRSCLVEATARGAGSTRAPGR